VRRVHRLFSMGTVFALSPWWESLTATTAPSLTEERTLGVDGGEHANRTGGAGLRRRAASGGDGLRAAATKVLVAMGGTGNGRTGRGGEGEGRGVAFAAGLQTEGDEARGYVLKQRSVRGQEKERLRRCRCDWMTVRACMSVGACACADGSVWVDVSKRQCRSVRYGTGWRPRCGFRGLCRKRDSE
jgi:hypothetical protein